MIEINIIGSTKTGKTTIAIEILKHLNSLGFNCIFEDVLKGDDIMLYQEKRIKCVLKKYENESIKIKQIQLRRK